LQGVPRPHLNCAPKPGNASFRQHHKRRQAHPDIVTTIRSCGYPTRLRAPRLHPFPSGSRHETPIDCVLSPSDTPRVPLSLPPFVIATYSRLPFDVATLKRIPLERPAA